MMENIQMSLDTDFFKEEARCGCTVSSDRKKIWAVELDLLNVFFRVCRENNIEAYAFAGTLLGAVRHHGFIPWDDDVDVCMTRENYEKLKRIAPAVFQPPYFFQTSQSDMRFFSSTARLRNSMTTGIIPWNYSSDYNNGIFMDCHVMDAVSGNVLLYGIQKKILFALQYIMRSYRPRTSMMQRSMDKRHRVKKKIIKSMVKYETLLKFYENVCQMSNRTSETLAFINTVVFSDKYRCRKSDLSGNSTLRFEGLDIPVPRNAERILTEIYGNFMELPPVEERETYHNSRIIFDVDCPYSEYFKTHDAMIWDDQGRRLIKVSEAEISE